MLKKGIISNISGNSADVSFPDEDYTTTAILPFVKSINAEEVSVGDKCVVALFEADYINFADGVILAII